MERAVYHHPHLPDNNGEALLTGRSASNAAGPRADV